MVAVVEVPIPLRQPVIEWLRCGITREVISRRGRIVREHVLKAGRRGRYLARRGVQARQSRAERAKAECGRLGRVARVHHAQVHVRGRQSDARWDRGWRYAADFDAETFKADEPEELVLND